jgi:chromosome segregation ATPase
MEDRSNIMTENVDFVNSYIERLNKTVHDLTGRNVILETRLEVSEKAAAQHSAEIELHQNELAARSKQLDHIYNDNKQLTAEIAKLKEQIQQLSEPEAVVAEDVVEVELDQEPLSDPDKDDF